jgi:hypothetical protein
MRGELEWEKELVAVARHVMIKRGQKFCDGAGLRLRVSHQMLMEIQTSRFMKDIYITTRDMTWQGIPMRVDHTLPPGCFIFEEGDFDGND